MMSIVRGESLKFFYAKSWLLSGIIIFVISLFFLVSVSSNTGDWKQELSIENQQIEQNLKMTADELKESKEKDEIILKWQLNNKSLEKGSNSFKDNGFNNYFANLLSVKGLGLIYVIFPIIFCVSVAKEFESKSINFILTSPFQRNKYFWGKLLSNLGLIFLFLVSILLINFLIGTLLYGGMSFNDTVFYISHSAVQETSAMNYVVSSILRSLPYYFVYGIIGFCLSIATRSTVISLTVTLFFALLGNQLAAMVPFKSAVIFFLPAIIDLTNYMGSPTYLQFSNIGFFPLLAIIFIYLVIIIVGAKFVFEKNDI